jgi:O-antigen/teichoic acid export membrane protein
MGFTIIMKPFWSAFTEAWVKKEMSWIKSIMGKLYMVWLGVFFLCIIMIISSNWVYDIWIGDKADVPFNMSLLVGIWILLNTWNSIFSHFLNGVSKIRLQLYIGVISAILNIPLAIYLGKMLGINGVFIANILVVLIGTIIYPLQYKKIISGNAFGVFNK